MTPRLQVRDLAIRFGGVQALERLADQFLDQLIRQIVLGGIQHLSYAPVSDRLVFSATRWLREPGAILPGQTAPMGSRMPPS